MENKLLMEEEEENDDALKFAVFLSLENGEYGKTINITNKICKQKLTDLPLDLLEAHIRALISMERYIEALDLISSYKQETDILLKLKAECLYFLGEYTMARMIFAQLFDFSPLPEISQWIHRCELQNSLKLNDFSKRIVFIEPQNDPNLNRDWNQTIHDVILSYNIKEVWRQDKTFFINVTVNQNIVDVVFLFTPQLHYRYILYKPLSNQTPKINLLSRTPEIYFKKLVPELWPYYEIAENHPTVTKEEVSSI